MAMKRPNPRQRHAPNPRREGAAMLIVMMILLMSTATAVFAVHATSYEIRASGHMRRAMQTQYVGETGAIAATAWVDRWGPKALLNTMEQSSGHPDFTVFNEPQLAPGKDGYRLMLDDLSSPTGTLPIARESMGGTRQAFEPEVYLDIYDTYTWTGTLAGNRSDGYGKLKYMRGTYKSRGRTRVSGVTPDNTGERTYHESASDAIAHGRSGPYGG
jgi:hypothetical protein